MNIDVKTVSSGLGNSGVAHAPVRRHGTSPNSMTNASAAPRSGPRPVSPSEA